MTFVWCLIAAFAEIAGCFAFWAWARLDRSPLWLVPGMISLALFAWVLERGQCFGRASLRGLRRCLHHEFDAMALAC
jgi:drug/metabolite transporter superfamily protein YnfA